MLLLGYSTRLETPEGQEAVCTHLFHLQESSFSDLCDELPLGLTLGGQALGMLPLYWIGLC